MKLNYIAVDQAIRQVKNTYPSDQSGGPDDLTPADFIASGAEKVGLNSRETTKLLRKAFVVMGGDLFNAGLFPSQTTENLQTVKRAVR